MIKKYSLVRVLGYGGQRREKGAQCLEIGYGTLVFGFGEDLAEGGDQPLRLPTVDDRPVVRKTRLFQIAFRKRARKVEPHVFPWRFLIGKVGEFAAVVEREHLIFADMPLYAAEIERSASVQHEMQGEMVLIPGKELRFYETEVVITDGLDMKFFFRARHVKFYAFGRVDKKFVFFHILHHSTK